MNMDQGGYNRLKIALACDHGGLDLKAEIIQFLQDNHYEFKDLGTYDSESVDYPDYALPVAEAVRSGEYDRGILFCGTGFGISIAANKVPHPGRSVRRYLFGSGLPGA
jgi:ribose 5-phosphate isomerase B